MSVPIDDDPLPSLVKKSFEGWLTTTNNGTVANTLLAAVATAIFVYIQAIINFPPPTALPALPPGSPKANALIIVAYLAIILNCNAAAAAFLLADRVVATPFNVAQRNLVKATRHHGSLHNLVDFYVDWRWWAPLRYYWIANIFLGILSIFVELILYVCLIEQEFMVKFTVTTFAALGILPLAIFVLDLALNHLPFAGLLENKYSALSRV